MEAGDSFLNAAWDSEDEAKKPSAFTHQAWVYTHNCIRHTYEEFHTAADAVINGREYIPTNVPASGGFCQDNGKNV